MEQGSDGHERARARRPDEDELIPVPGVSQVPADRLMLVVAEMVAHLHIQRRLNHRLGQRLEQPIGAGQGGAAVAGLTDQLRAALISSAEGL